jgi:dUTPase
MYIFIFKKQRRDIVMQFIKTRDVKNPERNVAENAGIDIYIPNKTPEFVEALLAKNPQIITNKELLNMGVKRSYIEDNTIWIAPHSDVIIPSGIRSKFASNLALIANNKSGIATKKKLVFGASVIDASYQGEWHLHLINTSETYQSLEFGQKAIQFIPHLIATDEVEVLDLTPEEFYTEKTSRGDGWQGSTGVK